MSNSKTQYHVRLTQETFINWLGCVNVRIKKEPHGQRAFLTLQQPLIDQAAYQALGAQARNQHDVNDNIIANSIREMTSPQDLVHFGKFFANVQTSPLPPAPPNPAAPGWWPSPGRAAYDAANAKFAGIQPNKVAAHRTRLLRVTIGQHRGNVKDFINKFSNMLQIYKTAAASAGQVLDLLTQQLFCRFEAC